MIRRGDLRRSDNRPTFRPVVLCCFGRGGSSMVWNMIGASPDVLMTGLEWHEAVFREDQRLPRTVRALHRRGYVQPQRGVLRLVNRHIAVRSARSIRRAVEPGEVEAKPQADRIVVKLMDYHLLHIEALERGFPQLQPILLTRDPLAQAESCMRSGLTLEAAAQWCDDVLRLMDRIRRRWRAPVVRFEDLIVEPDRFVNDLYHTLGLRRPHDGCFRIKEKAFGAARRGNVDGSAGYRRVQIEDFGHFVDPTVNLAAIDRLSRAERAYIQQRVRTSALRFGYA